MVVFSYRERLLKVHQLLSSLCNGTRDNSAFRVVFTSFYSFVVVVVVVRIKSHFTYKQVCVQNHLHLFVNAVY